VLGFLFLLLLHSPYFHFEFVPDVQESDPLESQDVPSRARGKRLTSLSLGPGSVPRGPELTREEVQKIRDDQERQLARQQRLQRKIINSQDGESVFDDEELELDTDGEREKGEADKDKKRDIKPALSVKRITLDVEKEKRDSHTNNNNNNNNKSRQSQSRSKRPEFYLELDPTWQHVSGTEGILYIHGINHTLEDALKRYLSVFFLLFLLISFFLSYFLFFFPPLFFLFSFLPIFFFFPLFFLSFLDSFPFSLAGSASSSPLVASQPTSSRLCSAGLPPRIRCSIGAPPPPPPITTSTGT
jgi:hypothetical protein